MDYSPDPATQAWGHLRNSEDASWADLECSDPSGPSASNNDAAFAVAGDFDGDGRDELAVAESSGTHFWVMAFGGPAGQGAGSGGDRAWQPLPDFTCSDDASKKALFAVAGDFDGDGQDEIAVGSPEGEFWVMDFDTATSTWGHLGAGAEDEGQPDFECDQPPLPPLLAVAADFDRDGLDEIAIARDFSAYDDVMTGPLMDNFFWVMKFDPAKNTWGHLGVDFSCGKGSWPWPVDSAVAGDFDGDGAAELAVLPYEFESNYYGIGINQVDLPVRTGNRCWVMDFDPESGRWRHLRDFVCSRQPCPANGTTQPCAANGKTMAVGDFDGDGLTEIAIAPTVLQINDIKDPLTGKVVIGHSVDPVASSIANDFWVMDFSVIAEASLDVCTFANATPIFDGPFDVTDVLTDNEVQTRIDRPTTDSHKRTTLVNQTYLEEAWYFVPMQIALQLQQRGHYTEALDWFRTVYDYVNGRKIYYGLETPVVSSYERASDWLSDPLNPHHIAATREDAYKCYTLLSIVRCLLDSADAEFTRDTAESVPRARTLYITALEILELPVMAGQPSACDSG